MSISNSFLMFLAVICMCAAGVVGWVNYRRHRQQSSHIDAVIEGRQFQAGSSEALNNTERWSDGLLHVASNSWLNTSWGNQFVAQEDRELLVQCGYQSSESRGYFLLSRLAGAVLLPLIALLFIGSLESASSKVMAIFFAAAVGFLLPKWILRSKAKRRMKRADQELPVLVDLLCLLQGAGLGIDQSLQMIAQDFSSVMPVLSGELGMANRLHASGRSREQALLRMSEMFKSDALADLSALIVQIDKHGGAVQEPLLQFAARLREQRQMRMKEEIGKITVKMTVVMILTLLPSLMIIIAGPGFLSVIRALGNLK